MPPAAVTADPARSRVPGRAGRGPVDPRLLRISAGVRGLLVTGVVVAGLTAVLVVVQAFALADVITGAFQRGLDLTAVWGAVVIVAGAVLVRAALSGLGELAAGRAALRTSAELRAALVAHVARLGPVWLTGERRAEIATLATRGVDSIEPYVARYLPQLVVAVVVPATVGFAILTQDLLAAVVVAITVPLIPLFMVVIGLYTQRATARQWRALSVLSHHFLDVVAGLPTLMAFGRAKVQAERMREVDARYRTTTMGVLRISFLSSLVLELLATLSVAAVAVSIGLRLVDGDLDLRTALIVLILAPEVYLPIRMVGMQFHAAADGVSAAAQIFDVLEAEPPASGTRDDIPSGPVRLRGVGVTYPGRERPAVRDVELTLVPGRITALVGESGAGKSTVLAVLLGDVRPDEGTVLVGDVPLAELDVDAWTARLGWVGQDPVLLGPTVADDVRLGAPGATDEQVADVLRRAGLDPVTLPAGIGTPVGDLAFDVSAGQRRRIALARALLRCPGILLLDEPSAGLDEDAEHDVAAAVRAAAADGAAVLVVAHRPALTAVADDTVTVLALDACRGGSDRLGRASVGTGPSVLESATATGHAAGRGAEDMLAIPAKSSGAGPANPADPPRPTRLSAALVESPDAGSEASRGAP